jgi:hypothetical protein
MTEPSGTFLSPITHELMVDPVIDPDGNSYERKEGKARFPCSLRTSKFFEVGEVSLSPPCVVHMY